MIREEWKFRVAIVRGKDVPRALIVLGAHRGIEYVAAEEDKDAVEMGRASLPHWDGTRRNAQLMLALLTT